MSESEAELLYVVLHHTGIDEPHFDLLIETSPGSDLAAWRSPIWPIDSSVQMTRLKNHRRIYLNYEGEISGDRGYALRVDGGTCRLKTSPRWVIQFPTGRSIALSLIHGDQWEATCESRFTTS